MALSVKPKPLAVCSVCQMPSVRREDLNHRCRSTFQGRRCYGTFKSGVTVLWDRCESCKGHGQVGTQPCAECHGFGWRVYA
jgi:DnaJ-class molecular chaperone